MIDAEKGVVEGPGGGTNKYCAQELDWMQVGATQLKRKIIKECTTLHISETAYDFSTTSEILGKRSDDLPNDKIQVWASGKLNRITGEFSATQTLKVDGRQRPEFCTSTAPCNSDPFDHIEWKMTCVPVQRKF